MKEQSKFIRILYIIGVVILLIGAFDPLEGSVLIISGSAIVSLTTFLIRDRHWKMFLVILIMILFGVVFLFYFSSLGGLGEGSSYSMWWGLLMLPYPIGWLMMIITLIVWAIKKPNKIMAE